MRKQIILALCVAGIFAGCMPSRNAGHTPPPAAPAGPRVASERPAGSVMCLYTRITSPVDPAGKFRMEVVDTASGALVGIPGDSRYICDPAPDSTLSVVYDTTTVVHQVHEEADGRVRCLLTRVTEHRSAGRVRAISTFAFWGRYFGDRPNCPTQDASSPMAMDTIRARR